MLLCRKINKNTQFIVFQVIFHYISHFSLHIHFTRARPKDRANSNQGSHRVRR